MEPWPHSQLPALLPCSSAARVVSSRGNRAGHASWEGLLEAGPARLSKRILHRADWALAEGTLGVAQCGSISGFKARLCPGHGAGSGRAGAGAGPFQLWVHLAAASSLF